MRIANDGLGSVAGVGDGCKDAFGAATATLARAPGGDVEGVVALPQPATTTAISDNACR